MLNSLISSTDMKPFYAEVNGFDKVGPIERWRIEPTAENFYKVPLSLRPNEIQLTRPHWPIVDWIPHPSIRHKLILHAEEYDLSEVASELTSSYCYQVEEVDGQFVELSYTSGQEQLDRVEGRNSIDGHARALGPAGGSSTMRSQSAPIFFQLQEFVNFMQEPGNAARPLPSLSEDLITRMQLACREVDTPFKIDPEFFKKFPGLYNEYDVAQGVLRSIFDPLGNSSPTTQLR